MQIMHVSFTSFQNVELVLLELTTEGIYLGHNLGYSVNVGTHRSLISIFLTILLHFLIPHSMMPVITAGTHSYIITGCYIFALVSLLIDT